MDLFIFGTLLHAPLLEVVIGNPSMSARISKAAKPGYSVSRVSGQTFPMLHPDPDGHATGVIVEGLDAAALARLDYYEGAFGYDRVKFSVLDHNMTERAVETYLPRIDRWTPADAWDLDDWTKTQAELTVLTAREAIAGMGILSTDEMGRLYPQMKTRAASRLRASRQDRASGVMQREDVDLIETRRPYTGFINIEEADLRFRRYDGTMSNPVERAVCIGVDCAIVLPYDPVRDRVLLIEQFRQGAYLRGDPNPWTVEPIAGRIDPGEDPEHAARREATEEAGITLRDLSCVSAAYPSPGMTSEYFFVYVGTCDLPDGTEGVGGVATEAEDIRSCVMDWADFDLALNAGAFQVLPLVVAGHWLARHREGIRAAG